MTNVLGTMGVKALEGRGIDPEIAARLEIHTATSSASGEVIPDEDGNIIVFPFLENGEVVAEKYRAAGKRFWQRAGGKRTFYNVGALDDPGLADGSQALVITEGEIDCLSAMTVGFPLSVSVPDGAPPPPKDGDGRQEADLKDDAHGKFEFLWANRDRLKKVKRFIIAVDNDAPGKHLAEELVRRLSAARCSFVVYPDGCKDLNDVLVRHGPQAAHDVLAKAKAYPLQGVYRLSDYPDRPAIITYGTGWATLDHHFKMFFPSFIVVSGIPSHGKSSLVAHLLINMAEMHGYRSAIFSPEMPVIPHLRDKMRRIVARQPLDRLSSDRLAVVDHWIDQNFVFLDHDLASDDDKDLTLEWVMERAADAVLRYGIRILVVDPWNEVEHAKDKNESTTEYINRSLRRLKKFGLRLGLSILVVAHPTKFVLGKDGKTRVPTPYDIDGSSAWSNKPDIIMIVHRKPDEYNQTQVFIDKVRFEGTGERGHVVMRFNRDNSRFEMLQEQQETM